MNSHSPIHSRLRLAGFTMIELLVVMAIVSLLSIVALSSYQATQRHSRNGKRLADIAQVRSALEVYRATEGEYPQIAGSPSNSNFVTLVSASYLEPYLSSLVNDPSSDPNYVYEYASVNPGTYQLCYYLEPGLNRECDNNP